MLGVTTPLIRCLLCTAVTNDVQQQRETESTGGYEIKVRKRRGEECLLALLMTCAVLDCFY